MKASKILLITEFSKQWNNGWYYKTGFEKNGHVVICFDPSSVTEPEKRVFEITRESRPDLIIHTKDELPAGIFQELRRFAKVIQWYPDPVIPEWLPPYVKASDVFFTMSEGLMEDFRRLGAEHVFWLTQAFEPSFFRIREVTEEDRKSFSTEVTFVGNLGSKPQYLPRRRYLELVIREGFGLKWWGPKIPRKLSTILLLSGKLAKSYGGKFVWGEEYAKIAKLSKIFLAFDSMPGVKKSMSARLYTAVGCGAFYLCQHVEGIEQVLLPGKEIVTFQSEQEMIDMIRYYLKHDEARKNISEAGKARVLRDHTYEARTKQMLRMIDEVM
jgi:spore maturation protein CgeB